MVVIVALAGWFGSVEQMVLLTVALGTCAYLVRARYRIPGIPLAVLSPGLALVLVQAGDGSDRYPRSHVAVGGGVIRGMYDVFLGSTGGEDCTGYGEPLHEYDAERAYSGSAASVAYRLEESEHEGGVVQASFFFGQDDVEEVLQDGVRYRGPIPAGSVTPPGNFRLRGLRLSGGVDARYVGVRGGIVIGDLTNGLVSTGLRFSGGIRAGAVSSGFVELHANDFEPLSPPSNEVFVSGGIGRGLFGNRIRVGIGSRTSLIGTFRVVAPSTWEWEGILGYRNPERSNSFYPILGLGLRKRFGGR